MSPFLGLGALFGASGAACAAGSLALARLADDGDSLGAGTDEPQDLIRGRQASEEGPRP